MCQEPNLGRPTRSLGAALIKVPVLEHEHNNLRVEDILHGKHKMADLHEMAAAVLCEFRKRTRECRFSVPCIDQRFSPYSDLMDQQKPATFPNTGTSLFHSVHYK
jgi:hypothetical protein